MRRWNWRTSRWSPRLTSAPARWGSNPRRRPWKCTAFAPGAAPCRSGARAATTQVAARAPLLQGSEEHADAGLDVAAGQGREVLEERGVRACYLVEQVAAVEEQLPGVAGIGVGVPGEMRVQQGVARRGRFQHGH